MAWRNWLLFGERTIAHDYLCRTSCKAGWPVVIWRCWTWRFHGTRRKIYVQDRLRESAEVLRKWLADGAAIYVCGSLQGMAAGVDQALVDILGREAVERLIEQGRYRRDVY
jgi:sulfite reductase (NADPH) flavoprotein alpha-component